MTPLLAFYLGSHPDHRGRMLAEIVRQDDDWLEVTHDYIQWLFPLTEFSRVVPGAPILGPSELAAFRSDVLLRDHMRVAYRRMLGFFGLALQDSSVVKGPHWDQRKGNWFTQDSHNSLRITRMLKSMSILGLEAEASAFREALLRLCQSEPDCDVSAKSQEFWLRTGTQEARKP